MLVLPDSLRSAFKEPFGPVYTDTERLLAAVDETAAEHDSSSTPLIAVGDVVSYHILTYGRQPDVLVIDGKTEREAVDSEIEARLAELPGTRREVRNPPAELSEELLMAISDAIVTDEPVTIRVDGEEDLATLPAIVAAPRGSSVIYGQPGEGMVHVAVTAEQQREARRLLDGFDGDTDRALAVVDD